MSVKVRRIIKEEVEAPGLHQKIAEARMRSGRSVKEVCVLADISRTYWNRLIKGKEDAIAWATVQKLEKIFDTDFGISFP